MSPSPSARAAAVRPARLAHPAPPAPGAQLDSGCRPDFFQPVHLRRQAPDFGIQFGYFLFVLARFIQRAVVPAEQFRQPSQRNALPLFELSRVDACLRRQLADRLLYF